MISDHAALERIEIAAMADFYQAAPAALRGSHAIDVRFIAGATCLTCGRIDPTLIFRRVVGLGIDRPASTEELAEVLGYMDGLKQSYSVHLSPNAQPAALGSWIEARGFTRGYAWMKFARPCAEALEAITGLDIRIVGREYGEVFGHVVTEAFGFAPEFATWAGTLPGREKWICLLAFAGEGVAGGAAAYVDGAYAWLGFAATLPAYRRKGVQNALLAHRLLEAARRGAHTAVTETGERLPDKPSNSYRNILRAGFAEIYLRQNYLSPM